jgi:hypothetical protein
MKARSIGCLVFTLTAFVLVGCGGGGAASGNQWNATNGEIRHLVAEIKPHEVRPGCNPSQEEIERATEVLKDRASGERPSGPFLEESFQAADEQGDLLLTSDQERIACSRKEAFRLKVEAEQKRMAQEADAERHASALVCGGMFCNRPLQLGPSGNRFDLLIKPKMT